MKRSICVFPAALFAALPLAAKADPLPDSVAAMITAAADSGNAATLQATVDMAKKTNPGSTKEIDALVAQLQASAAARHRAQLETQGFFEGWTGQGQAGFSNSTGNTRSTAISLGLALTRDGLDWKHSFNATVDYQRDNGVEDKDRDFVSWESDYKITDRFYALGLLSWEADRFSGFNSRLSESVGLGYSLIQDPDMTLSVEAGPALRQTDYVIGESENNFAGRAAAHYQWKILPSLTFNEDVSFYGASNDSTFTSDTGLTAALIGALSARLSYHVQYESNPPDALETTDTLSQVALVYSF